MLAGALEVQFAGMKQAAESPTSRVIAEIAVIGTKSTTEVLTPPSQQRAWRGPRHGDTENDQDRTVKKIG
jgi:hypothetical protein